MGKRIDLVGKRFGRLTVIRLSDVKDNRNTRKWECLCDCGNICYVTTTLLNKGNTKSCGCLYNDTRGVANRKDLTGQKFGKLLALEVADKEFQKRKGTVWKCQCDCGNITYVPAHSLLCGNTKSCGCMQVKLIKDITGQQFGHWTVINLDGKHEDGFYYWLCRCDCGTEKIVRGNNLKTGDSTNCGCIRSKGELFVKKWLNDNNIIFQDEYTFPDLNGDYAPLRFDFCINNNKLIEVMGVQHYEDREWGGPNLKRYDEMKRQYCENKNIPLLYLKYNKDSTIPEEEWAKLLQNFLMEEMPDAHYDKTR